MLAALLVVMVLPVTSELRALWPVRADAGVDGYPQRVGHQWWMRELPDRPGPIAGVVELVHETSARSTPRGWYAVTERGHRWRLPADPWTDHYPSVSADGARIGYLVDHGGPYVIHDLVTGQRTEFPQVGISGLDPTMPAYGVYVQNPSFWSPDGNRLIVKASQRDDEESHGLLVLSVDGSDDYLTLTGEGGASPGHIVGWSDNDTLLLVRWEDFDDWDAPIDRVLAQEMTLDGRFGRTVQLRASSPWLAPSLNQWAMVLSPDGSRLLVIDDDRSFDSYVRTFSWPDGAELGDPVWVRVNTPCAIGWVGATPAVPILWEADDWSWYYATTARADVDDPGPMVVADRWLGTRCFIWAADALAGQPRGGVFGLHDWWWTWWWRELLLLLVVAAGVARVVAVRRWPIRLRGSSGA
jgi:hypothetical protein